MNRSIYDDDNRAVELTSAQKRGIIIMASIQFAVIFFTYAVIILQALSVTNVAKASIFGILLYFAFYFNFLKAETMLTESGISHKWIKLIKILSPVLYIPGALLAVLI